MASFPDRLAHRYFAGLPGRAFCLLLSCFAAPAVTTLAARATAGVFDFGVHRLHRSSPMA